jgi:uncharacterized membrane protein YfcA
VIVLEVLAVVGLGVLAGILSGVFGVGGGVVFVPALTLVLGLSQLAAEATSLLAIIPVALLGTWRQSRAGTVRGRDALLLGAASAITAVAGAVAAEHAPERVLRVGFALLLLATAWQLVRRSLGPKGVSGDPDGG